MTLLTALEMFSNPYDLEFLIGPIKDTEKWALMIARGPEQRGKPLLTGQDYSSKQETIDEIALILKICLEKGNDKSFSKSENQTDELIKTVISSEDAIAEEAMNMLTVQMVEQIKKQIESSNACSTHSWLVLLQKENTFAIALTDWDNVLEKAEGIEAAEIMINRNIPRLTQEKADIFLKELKNAVTN